MAKGGYQTVSRLETTIDEISIEAQVAAGEPSAEVMRRSFVEIRRLSTEAKELLLRMAGSQAPQLGFLRL